MSFTRQCGFIVATVCVSASLFLSVASARAQSCPTSNCGTEVCRFYDDSVAACVIPNCSGVPNWCPTIIPEIPDPPFSPVPNDRTFVIPISTPTQDCDPINNTGFLTRNLPVTRYVGDVWNRTCKGGSLAGFTCKLNSDCPGSTCQSANRKLKGLLRDPGGLVSAGALGSHARLTIMAWDVDSKGSPGCGGSGEVNRVLFNGHYLGTLHGDNRTWAPSRFYLPVEWIKFPTLSSSDGPPAVLSGNIIQIGNDSGGGKCWCIDIGWISLEIRATSPVVLLHGVGGTPTFWTDNNVVTFIDGLEQEKILFDAELQIPNDMQEGADSIETHLIGPIQTKFGVDSVHLVAHSKGGLHALTFLSNNYDENTSPVHVLSLTTLDSPLKGAIMADILETKRRYFLARLANFPSEFLLNGLIVVGVALFPDSVQDLSVVDVTRSMGHIVNNLPNFIQYNTIGSDTDLNSNGILTNNEIQSGIDFVTDGALVGRDLISLLSFLFANTVYQTNGRVDSVRVRFSFLDLAIVANPSSTFRENDILVTLDSAKGVAGYRALVDRDWCRNGHRFEYNGVDGRNHADVADKDVALQVAGWIRAAERQMGDMASWPNFVYGPEGAGQIAKRNVFECRID